ncbi:MAG: hypothetical protein AB7U73_22085, partial [Pirellulales bacterium]
QIADKVGVHVTTVSRAVDDKWIHTPRGIFPLKRFFGGGTVSASGEEVAWDTVRLKLQEVIDAEDKRSPFSDDDLVKELARHGLTVARRTVTKYRKAMKIPSSRERRDWTLVENSAAEAAATAQAAPATDTLDAAEEPAAQAVGDAELTASAIEQTSATNAAEPPTQVSEVVARHDDTTTPAPLAGHEVTHPVAAGGPANGAAAPNGAPRDASYPPVERAYDGVGQQH